MVKYGIKIENVQIQETWTKTIKACISIEVKSTAVNGLSSNYRNRPNNETLQGHFGRRHLCNLLDKKAQLTQGLRATANSAIIPRWPPATILDFIEPQIAPFDPSTPKTIT